MSWLDDLSRRAVPPFAINDSKTPSGRAHVGALRGVMIHDSIFRHLSRTSLEVKYTFGCDDYDALDELPHGLEDYYREYLGVPLCNVPAPPGEIATDIADFYISEFFGLFQRLGVSAKTYRMRDLYRSGQMDGVIDTILRNRTAVRDIYLRVNGSIKPDQWHPFQVICPQCGKIGSTIVTNYNGKEVEFECSPTLVTWAIGCGARGWVSPFGGGGKLPWKLEWAARWKVLGVTIEGAGKDHTTKGGSRDVADAVSREILDYSPPVNQPYEFFLVGGSKMSSSRGVGAAAAEIAQLLPPQVLRYLLIRTPARKALNFTPDLESITRLYTDYDRMLADLASANPSSASETLSYLSRLKGAEGESPRIGKALPWDTIVSLVQLPHVDFWSQAESRFDPPLSIQERAQLKQRVDSAELWLKRYAAPDERIELTDSAEDALRKLSNTQRAFLNLAGSLLQNAVWDGDEVQALLFDAARLTPIAQADAFAAVYGLFLGRASGPKAGSLLAFLNQMDVVDRLKSVRFSPRLLIEETSQDPDSVLATLAKRRGNVSFVTAAAEIETVEVESGAVDATTYVDGIAGARLTITTTQGRRETVRVELSRFKGVGSSQVVEAEHLRELIDEFMASVSDLVPVA